MLALFIPVFHPLRITVIVISAEGKGNPVGIAEGSLHVGDGIFAGRRKKFLFRKDDVSGFINNSNAIDICKAVL